MRRQIAMLAALAVLVVPASPPARPYLTLDEAWLATKVAVEHRYHRPGNWSVGHVISPTTDCRRNSPVSVDCGYEVFLGVDFPYTHDLDGLMELCRRAGLDLPDGLDGVETLAPFGVTFRYGALEPPGLDRVPKRHKSETDGGLLSPPVAEQLPAHPFRQHRTS
jgi:hypothetical protein